ncbi:MAG: polysaccharide pyruvyl transferase family protein [Sandaracinaceae bacterium]
MSFALRLLGRAAKGAIDGLQERLDADRLLQLGMRGVVAAARVRHETDPSPPWRPGEPLRLLLAGYNGTRNTGSDVRVEEIVRQFRHLFGDEHVDLSVTVSDPDLTRGYFRTAKQLAIPQVFHRFLYDTVRTQHGVVACEGSMFKSKFANALSTMMVGALGLATAEEKIAVGYGGEAGRMDPPLEELVRAYCRDALILPRTAASQRVLADLGVPTALGSDTAWTYEVPRPGVADKLLARAGWDGRRPVLAVCPVHPFWWPVRPDALRAAWTSLTGVEDESHYRSIYFHHDGPEVDRALRRYVRAIAGGVRDFAAEHPCFVILLGMERLDRRACALLDEALGGGTPTFVSDDHAMDEMVALLRRASLIASSRYHAMVCSMPAEVPAVGITIDERIRNLTAELGRPELALEVDDPGLDERLHEALSTLHAERDELRPAIGRAVVENLARMDGMGRALVEHVRTFHPAFPFRAGLGEGAAPWAHLPPPGPTTEALLEAYA